MTTQEKILREYSNLMGVPTLSEISQDTGIPRGRVFRITNGHEMRLGEYEIFSSKILEIKKKTASHRWGKQRAFKKIFTAFIQQYFQPKGPKTSQQILAIQQVFLTSEERKILKALIHNLHSFIESTQTTRSDHPKQKKKEKLTVFWGALQTPKTAE